MKAHYFPLIVLIALFGFGCNKTELTNLALNKGLIEKIKDKEGVIAEYTYNQNSTLKKSWHHSDYYMRGSNSEYEYTFNELGQLTNKSGFEPGNMFMSSMIGAMDKDVYYSYVYDKKGQLEKVIIDYDYKEFAEINYTLLYNYSYPSEKLITKAINRIYPDSKSIMNYEDFVMDGDDNIAEIIAYTMLSPTEKHVYSKTVFTYDTKNAPFTFEPGPMSKHNMLTKTVIAYNYDEKGKQSVAYTSDYNYQYEYNAEGYPEKMVETYPNEIQIIKYYFYR